MDLCKYKDILGKPESGIHKYRLFGIAIVDVVFTIIGAYLIAIFFKFPILYTVIGLFILGIIAHRLFCVRTTIDKLLFP
jgi:uncharacterized membrane protein